jgi:hypothetical protein
MLKKGIRQGLLYDKLNSYIRGENIDEVRKTIFAHNNERGHLPEQDTADVDGFGFIDGRRFCYR